jgi:hypothetical protein
MKRRSLALIASTIGLLAMSALPALASPLATTIGTDITSGGTITGVTVTDGTASLSGGALTGLTTALSLSQGGTGATTASGARTSLGLGTAATSAATDFATAAQGAKADSALQSFTELDPVFGASAAHGISSGDIANWNGKLSSETDPVFTAWNRSTGISIANTQVTGLGTASAQDVGYFATAAQGAKADTALQSYTETDPVFGASAAYGIGSGDISNWNGAVTLANSAVQTESDPAFTAWDKSAGISIANSQVSDFQTGVSANADVVNGATAFGWGNHAAAGYALASSLGTAAGHAAADFATAAQGAKADSALQSADLAPYLTASTAATTYVSNVSLGMTLGSYLTSAAAATDYQPKAANLTSWAGIAPADKADTSALASYLTTATAASTYLTQAAAASGYATFTQGATADTAVQPAALTSALGSYLTTAAASSGYQPLAANLTSWAGIAPADKADTSALASYLTTATAASTYQTIGNYAAAADITGDTLAATVVTSSLTSVGTLTDLTVTNPIVGSVTGNAGTVTGGVYTAGADSVYLTPGTAASTYLTTATAGTTYQSISGHLKSTGPAVTIDNSTAAPCTAASVVGGTDTRGTVTASDCTPGQTLTITFGATYDSAPTCVISPTNAAAGLGAASGVASVTSTASKMTITANTGTAGPATWNYICIE